MNNEDPLQDRVRGWKDVLLSDEGKREAYETGKHLRTGSPKGIVSSDLKRALETANIISEISKIPLLGAMKGLRPWDIGHYTGQLSEKVVPIIVRYAVNKPDMPIPGGESFDEFYRRFFSALMQVVRRYGNDIALVTHHRNERLLKAWAVEDFDKYGKINMVEFNQKGEHTGAVWSVDVPLDRLLGIVAAFKEPVMKKSNPLRLMGRK